MSEKIVETEALLAARMRALQRFRSAIEHELRSGLNSVVLNVELLGMQVERLTAPGEVDLEREAEALRDLVAGLREGADALTKRIEMTVRTALPIDGASGAPADLVDLARNLAVFLAFEARLLGVQCEAELAPPPAAIPVAGRRSLVQAALLGLGAEGLRQVAPRGVLRLSLEEVEGSAVVELSVHPFLEGAAAEETQGLAAICAEIGATFESQTEGEARRLRLRLPRQD